MRLDSHIAIKRLLSILRDLKIYTTYITLERRDRFVRKSFDKRDSDTKSNER